MTPEEAVAMALEPAPRELTAELAELVAPIYSVKDNGLKRTEFYDVRICLGPLQTPGVITQCGAFVPMTSILSLRGIK